MTLSMPCSLFVKDVYHNIYSLYQKISLSYFPCIYKYQSNVQQDTFPKQTKNGAKIIDEFYIPGTYSYKYIDKQETVLDLLTFLP